MAPNVDDMDTTITEQDTLRLGIIIGSTRPGRLGPQVADWVYKLAIDQGHAEYELLDLATFSLPLLDEPIPAMAAPGSQPHTKRWAQAIADLDGFVFVTPEYNHGVPAALKNAIDFLFTEWNDKTVGFVGYGADGAVRAVEHLRGVMAQTRAATVGSQVALSLTSDFENFSDFTPRPAQNETLAGMLHDLVRWAMALRRLRSEASATRAGATD